MRKFKAKRNRTIFRSNTFLLLNIFFFFFFGIVFGGVFMCVCVFGAFGRVRELGKVQIMREMVKLLAYFSVNGR